MKSIRAILTTTIFLGILVSGCLSSVKVDKRPNVALPIYDSSSNIVEYVQIDQGYSVRYMRLGFSTEIQELSASLTTNKTVTFTLGGFNSTVPTNAVNISLTDLLKLARDVQKSEQDVQNEQDVGK